MRNLLFDSITEFSQGYFLLGSWFLITTIITLWAALHALIYKRESRAAVGWVGIILLNPFLGVPLYYLLGINRISRKAKRKKLHLIGKQARLAIEATTKEVEDIVDTKAKGIINTGENLKYSPICPGTKLQILNTGDAAYPQMLEAIKQAKKSITLLSYIFTADDTGMDFVKALGEARQRGVEVRVLIDSVGSASTRKKLIKELKKRDVLVDDFLPVTIRSALSNLRNHRKILVVDGNLAFTGGLNIAQIYWPERAGDKAVLDLHFRVEGIIVKFLQQVFIDDWYFTTGELLEGPTWFSKIDVKDKEGDYARLIVDGPGDDLERMRWHFLSAINAAERKIRIITPYFLPDAGVTAALASAALRGVEVDVLLPAEPDHMFMKYAIQGSLFELLHRGVKIWWSPPPFDHTKLMVIDDTYFSIGSSNWDPRSLRLNFEVNIEAHSPELAKKLIDLFDRKMAPAAQYTMEHLLARTMPEKIRDGFWRLFSPYL